MDQTKLLFSINTGVWT